MKAITIPILLLFTLILICTSKSKITEADKKQVEKEILEAMNEFAPAIKEPMDPEKLFSLFIQTDELVAASKGNLIKDPKALLDTMKLHMSAMQKQVTRNVDDKIFVISKEAAVISSSKMITVTLKSGCEFTIPVALTILWVKRDRKWKIVQYHN